jgi:AcrR family transcriptional regulator
MTADLGKREAHKLATRRAIQEAADDLFGRHGYVDTTVRDIADAAGVTERTFFRYFAGKESLLVGELEAWLPLLAAEIGQRPATEHPLDAIERAFFALVTREARPNLSWLFHDGPPGPKLEKSTPGLLLRFEQTIADALESRRTDGSDADSVFTSQVVARSAVAALRSAGIRNWQLRTSSDGPRPDEGELITRAFAILRTL